VERWHGLDQVPADWPRGVVTVGVFDGVHRGHQHIIGRAMSRGRDEDMPVTVLTFDPNPLEVVRPGSHPPLLSTVDFRGDLLAGLGVDALLVLPFTPELAKVTAADFVSHVLVDTLHAAAVVVGENFRFGHRASGDVALLVEKGRVCEFQTEEVPLFREDGTVFSSTAVRERLAEGDVAGAAWLLGRPHRVQGTVVEGDKRGRDLGYPTANLEAVRYAAIPTDGVYAGWLALGPEAGAPRLPAAVSVGTNPTFGGSPRRVEAYALDRDDLDLYGRTVAVDFAERLREMVRFDSVAELQTWMADDVARTRTVLAAAESSPEDGQ
jgi:riboflavin kinase / FMN adenylyltransferase